MYAITTISQHLYRLIADIARYNYYITEVSQVNKYQLACL